MKVEKLIQKLQTNYSLDTHVKGISSLEFKTPRPKRRKGKLTRQEMKSKLLQFIPHRPSDGCWEWVGGGSRSTYGFKGTVWDGEKNTSALRWIYSIYNDRKVSKSAVVLRNCGNNYCHRPEHLSLAKDRSTAVKRQHRQDLREPLYGLANGQAKWSDEDVVTMRVMASEGVSRKEISQKYSIPDRTLRAILTGEKRKAAGGPRMSFSKKRKTNET